MNFDKLMKLIGYLDQEGEHLFQQAVFSFFAEMISPGILPFEESDLDLERFKEEVGADVATSLFMCAVEFFLSNEYPRHSGSWNALDYLMKKRALFLSASDKMYLKGLRNSYMSLYEVVDIKLGQSLTLRNLIEEDQSPVVVKERQATYSACLWDVLGARVVIAPNGAFISGGTLILEREDANAAIETIQRITKEMTSQKNMSLFKEATEDPLLLIKKMWAKEITEKWLAQRMEEKQEPSFVNYDGDKLQFYTIEFPLKALTREIVRKINQLKELIPQAREDVTHAWFWPQERKTDKLQNHQKKPTPAQNQHRLDTQISDEEGNLYRLFAEIKIKGRKLIVDVNSEQRANIVEDFFQEQLSSLVGEPIRTHHERESSTEDSSELELTPSLSQEEEEKIIKQMFDLHYQEWVDSPLAFLNHKTPREAVKAKGGLQKVMDLLKDMEDKDLRAVKQGARAKPYPFDWIYYELGITRDGQLKGKAYQKN